MTALDREAPMSAERLAKIRRNDERDLRHAEKLADALDETAWERHVLLVELDRLRTPPPPGELRGLDALCAALHAASETEPLVKEVAWRTFALIRAHREQSAEVDRLNAELGWLRDAVNGVGGLSSGLPDPEEVARLRQAVNAYSATIDRVATVPGITVGGDGETYEIVRRSDLNIALGLTADGRGVS